MSQSLSDIKGRLASVQQTRKITNAMYLLSAARLKKEMPRAEAREQHTEKLRAAIAQLLAAPEAQKLNSDFTRGDKNGRTVFLVVAGEKGLCGSYYADIAAFTAEVIASRGENTEVHVFGAAGETQLIKHGIVPDKRIEGSASGPDASAALRINRERTDAFLGGGVREVDIICTPYGHSGRKPECIKLLPLDKDDFRTETAGEKTVFEPDIGQVFGHLAEAYCEGVIYSLLVSSSLSENAARMDAMRAATDNADEMSQALESELNIARQLNITNEITEIAAAAELQNQHTES